MLATNLKAHIALHEEMKNKDNQARLWQLRLNRGLAMLGLPSVKWGSGRIIFNNLLSKMSPEQSLWNTLVTEAKRYGVSNRMRPAYLAAMQVELPPNLSNKIWAILKKVGTFLKQIGQLFIFILVSLWVGFLLFLLKIVDGFRWIFRNIGKILKPLFVGVLIVIIIGAYIGDGILLYKLYRLDHTPAPIVVQPSTQAPVQSAVVDCPGSFRMQRLDPNPQGNKWIDGVGAIAVAFDSKSPEDAKKAFDAWLNGDPDPTRNQPFGVRNYKNELIPAAQLFLDENQWPKPDQISDEGSCANDTTIQLVEKIRIAVLVQGTVSAENAPTSGINTGIENGSVVSYGRGDVNGDIRSIKVETKIKTENGKKVKVRVRWILYVCGNVVTDEVVIKVYGNSPEHKHDVCDNCSPPVGKVGTQDPAPRGNALVGGGRNTDSGPGLPLVVTQPAVTSRVNPATPVTVATPAAPVAQPVNTVVDKTPPPPIVNPQAPTPAAPSAANDVAPGR